MRLRAAGRTLDVDIDTIEAGPNRTVIPWIDPFKMVCTLAGHDRLDLLHPDDSNLLEFWNRFSKVFPDHWVFKAASAGRLNLARTLPFYSHGDEGRGKRKKGILLWTMRGATGQGTAHFNSMHTEDARAERMGLNMGGSLTSRFLHVAVPKHVYGKVAEPVWDDIAFRVASSYRKLETEGFLCNGRQYHAVCLALTGDNPFLAKVAHLLRSYARVEKRPGDVAGHGICWVCMAGTPSIPFENYNMQPEWSHTVLEVTPWHTLPPFFAGLGCSADDQSLPKWLMFDAWHNFHGGVGKNMVASTAAEILQCMDTSKNLDIRLDEMNDAYQKWRTTSKLTLHYGGIDRDLFGLESGLQACPVGAWSKFSDTRVLMSFLEEFLRQRRYVVTEITELALQGVAAANLCFRICYQSGFWLNQKEAARAGRAGLRFLACYARLAEVTLREHRLRYPQMPKCHYLHHGFRDMVLFSRSCRWIPNLLHSSVQLDEDMVGRIARLSRRVGSRLLMQRTLERYLVTAHLAIFDAEKRWLLPIRNQFQGP